MVYSQEEANLHTHSFYCRHGVGTIKEYCDEAEKGGKLKVLGFSEHMPLPDKCLNYSTRMDFSDLAPYNADIRREKERTGIKVLLGGECDWIRSEKGFYQDCLLGEMGYDYILGSVHSMVSPDTGIDTYISRIGVSMRKILTKYVETYTEMLSSGLFLFGCHPDLFMADCLTWDDETKSASKDIISCAVDCNIPLEMNDCGLRKPMIETPAGKKYQYTNPEFWLLAKEMGAMIVTSSDAHDPKDITGRETDGYLSQTFALAANLGIEFASWDIGEDGKPVAVNRQ